MSQDSEVKLPRVAILLATFNGERWLAEQLESVFAQSGCAFHVFVNDDGSTDGTLSILKLPKFSGSISITQYKKGGAGQNFLGLIQAVDFSDFDYVAFCDQDDIWRTDKLSRAIDQIARHRVDAYSSNVTAFWPDGERRMIVKSQPQREFDYLFESAGPGCTFVITSDAALAFQDFARGCKQELLAKVTLHDWLIYGWARGTGRGWFIDNFSSLDYRQHENNVLGASRNKGAIKKRWEMVTDGWYLNQAKLNSDLVGTLLPPTYFLKERTLKGLLCSVVRPLELRRRKSEALFLVLVLVWHYLSNRRAEK